MIKSAVQTQLDFLVIAFPGKHVLIAPKAATAGDYLFKLKAIFLAELEHLFRFCDLKWS